MSNKYTRELRLRVAKEACKPENQGLEHVIAEKYNIMPWTVRKWAEHFREYGEDSFKNGFSSTYSKKTSREAELEKEVSELREEVKILKKAAAFLANVKHE